MTWILLLALLVLLGDMHEPAQTKETRRDTDLLP